MADSGEPFPPAPDAFSGGSSSSPWPLQPPSSTNPSTNPNKAPLNAGWPNNAAEIGAVPAPWLATGPGAGQPSPPARRTPPLTILIAIVVIIVTGAGVGAYALASGRPGSSSKHAATRAVPAQASWTDSAAAGTVSDPIPSATPPSRSTPVTSSATPPPADTSHEVAAQVDDVLAQSRSARKLVQPAIDAIQNCTATGGDISDLQQAADVRHALLNRLDRIPFEQMGGGPALKTALGRLLGASASADEAYVAWGNDQLGCSDTADKNDSNLTDALNFDAQSTIAKKRFIATWNPLALRYGLHLWRQDQI